MNVFEHAENGDACGFSDGFYGKAVRILSDYIQIPTINPPGDDKPGARFLEEIFISHDLQPEVIETAPGREALICSIPGSRPDLKPVVLAGHIDVVPADEDGWEVPPFSGQVKDGYIWGRGALDMKSMSTMQLMAFLAVFHRKMPIQRGITFLALPDEENSGELGARVIAANYLDILNPALIINEGGYGLRNMMVKGVVFPIVVAEKLSLKVKLTACGSPGHSNRPGKASSITKLVDALGAVKSLHYPMRIDPVVRATLQRLADKKSFPESFFLRHPDHPLIRPILDRAFKKDPTLNAMTRNTIATTVLKAGHASNAIPAKAEAILDLRLLPGNDYQRIVADIENKVSPYGVQVDVVNIPVPGEPTPFDSKVFGIIEEVLKKQVPEALVVPLLDIGGTDSKHFRPHGIPCYDIIPIVVEPEDLKRIHGINERISIENLKLGIRVMFEILQKVCNAEI